MKIEELRVRSDFRNLNGLYLKFDTAHSTNIIIGNNGAGKSNILEAFSSIFRTLYYGDRPEFEFDFSLRYHTSTGKKVVISSLASRGFKMNVDDNPIPFSDKTYLPKRVICNYSGEDRRIYEAYYERIYRDFYSQVIHSKGNETLKMVYVDKDIWRIILLIMLVTRDTHEAYDSFFKDVLGLVDNKAVSVQIQVDDKELERWKRNPNPAYFYIQTLADQLAEDGTIGLSDINKAEESAESLFNYMMNAQRVIKSIRIKLNSYDSGFMSEGEKKLMVIKFILESIADEDSLVLLDEPDSHIHISRKKDLKDYFDSFDHRDNIVTSHSPTMTATFDDKAIIMLDVDDGHAKVIDKDKQQIVSELTRGMWTLQEQNIFLTSHKDILLLEGEWDESYLTAAKKAFHNNGEYTDIDFACLPCGGAEQLVRLQSRFTPKAGQMLFAFWDADNAGIDAMRKVFNDNYKKEDFGIARKTGSVWFAFYHRWRKDIPNFNVEDYFTKRVLRSYINSFDSLVDIISRDNLKRAMAKDCETGQIGYRELMHFNKVFELIRRIKQADDAGETAILK
jgi:ABC-type cobalamin/Fe3+-siderophores transport system ATPase subunit